MEVELLFSEALMEAVELKLFMVLKPQKFCIQFFVIYCSINSLVIISALFLFLIFL